MQPSWRSWVRQVSFIATVLLFGGAGALSAFQLLDEEDGLIVGQLALSYTALTAVGESQTNLTFVPANYTAYYTVIVNSTAEQADLPLLVVFPIWNVEEHYFSRLLSTLAARGYPVMFSYTLEDFSFPVEGMPFPGCPEEQLIPAAATITQFAENLDVFEPFLGARVASPPDLVLMGAVTGGWTALLVASGACSRPWEFSPADIGENMVYCNNYTTYNGTIHGVVSYMGSPNVPGYGVELPPDVFSLILGSEWDFHNGTGTEVTFDASSGGSCNIFYKFRRMNEYAWCDWIDDPATGQHPPCAVEPLKKDFFPTREEQEEAVDLTADAADAAIRAAVLGDEGALQFLRGLASHPRVLDAKARGCLEDI